MTNQDQLILTTFLKMAESILINSDNGSDRTNLIVTRPDQFLTGIDLIGI